MRTIMSRPGVEIFPVTLLTWFIIQLLFCPLLNQAQDRNSRSSALTSARSPLRVDAMQGQSDRSPFALAEREFAKNSPESNSQSVLPIKPMDTSQGAWVEENGRIGNNKMAMMTDNYEKIVGQLMGLERWQCIAFAAACAERAALIFRSFGSPDSQKLYEQGLEMAWLGVTQQGLASQADQLIKKLNNMPEAEEDPEIFTYHYAQRSLIILVYALEAVRGNHIERARWTCSEALEFRDGLDDLLTEESQRIESYDLSDPPPPGALEILELKHQQQVLDLIKSVREPSSGLINSLRQLAQEANKDLQAPVSEIRKGRR